MEHPESEAIDEPLSSHPEHDNEQEEAEMRELEAMEEEMEEHSQRMISQQP